MYEKKKLRRAIGGALVLMMLGAGGSICLPDSGMPMAATVSAAAKVKPDKDGYVAKVTPVEPQTPLAAAKLAIPQNVRTADPQATPRTVALLKYLTAVQTSGSILYGHQNDMHRKVGKNLPSDSDTYDIVGDYPAVVGVDGLALTGSELELTPVEKEAGLTLPQKLARIAIKADRAGAIVTMSCHMPNFAEVAKKGKTDGRYDYSGYSPNHFNGNVAQRILPGGDLNEVYTGYLDLVADFDRQLQDADVPLLFRPFHENNGDWFWWGTGHVSSSDFIALFRYTEQYLQGKGLHNMLYVYSPDGSRLNSEGDYALTYPGSSYVDIAGIDMYHRNPERGDGFLEEKFSQNLDIVSTFAKAHHKVAAVTETGMLVGNSALARTRNSYKSWFLDAAKVMEKHHMAYFMTWANFSEQNFDQPYMIDATRGHEMINDFITFYNDPTTVFARQNIDYTQLK